MLNIGTQTGSLINHLQSRAVIGQPKPVVGMAATLLGWTDRAPGTIVNVEDAGKFTYITVQDDNYRVIAGSCQDGSADYEYSPNPKGRTSVFRIKDGGTWESVYFNEETKRWNKSGSKGVRIGERERYYDPSF